jgi:hypothetical protein
LVSEGDVPWKIPLGNFKENGVKHIVPKTVRKIDSTYLKAGSRNDDQRALVSYETYSFKFDQLACLGQLGQFACFGLGQFRLG